MVLNKNKNQLLRGIVFKHLFSIALIWSTLPALISAATSATQVLTLTVPISASISVSSGAVTIPILSLSSGAGSATDSSSTYTATSTADMGTLRITGQIDTAMPTNSTLSANLAAKVGTSSGTTLLSTTAANLVTAIDGSTGFTDANRAITLTFAVSPGYASGASLTRTVTYTITN